MSLLAYAASSSAIVISLDPRATYLLNTADPFGKTATNAVGYSLASLGFHAGDSVLIQRLGDYKGGEGTNASTGLPFTDNQVTLLAVFSSSSTLLGSLTLNRLPGAIDTDAPDVVSKITSWGNPYYAAKLATDITQDFDANNAGLGQALVIPFGAQYIFFSPNDNNFADNSDPDGDYGVSITALTAEVPEPGSLALLGMGIGMLGMSRRRKMA